MVQLANNCFSEKLLTLEEAARLFPGKGGRILHISTVFRWATKGAKGVLLESIRVGGKRYTSREALQRFIDRQNALLEDPGPLLRSPAARDRAQRRADEELDQEGI